MKSAGVQRNVAFVVASLSRLAGGLFYSVRRLAQSIESAGGTGVHVLGLNDEFTTEDITSWAPLRPRVFPQWPPRQLGYSPSLSTALMRANVDVVHTHGLWMYPSILDMRWAKRTGRPYIVSPRGMLEPWALNNSWWKKRLAWRLFESAHLRKAACLHALCEAEMRDMRALGLKNPIAVIPNGVDLPPETPETPQDPAPKDWAGRKIVLFLGRIHPKKGLMPLVRAWSKLGKRSDGWALAIAGPAESGHDVEVGNLVAQLGLSASVRLIGPQYDGAKNAWLRRSSAFILPSLSEGMPMAVLEAMAYGLPVVLTPRCNLPEVAQARAGLTIEPDADSIARGLEEMLELSERERKSMGIRGRTLLQQRFGWPHIARQMIAVYDWLIRGASRPGCVSAT